MGNQPPLLRPAFVRSLRNPLAVRGAAGPGGKGRLPGRRVRDRGHAALAAARRDGRPRRRRRAVGGARASIYNAMPKEGVEALASFMKDFKARNA